MSAAALCLCLFAIAVIVFVGDQVRFWLWCRQGENLSREFDALVRERETDLDLLIRDPSISVEEKRARIADLLERHEEHSQRRAAWLRSL